MKTPAEGTNDGGLASALGDGTGKAPSTGDKPSGDESKPKTEPPTAPEKYEAWKVPEGYELDSGLVEEATPIFKELGLNQEQSQKLVDFYAKHALQTAEETSKYWLDVRQGWRDEMKNSADLGKLVGKDGNFGPDSPLVVTVNKALDGLQNPKLVADFKDAMTLTGAGDNPAFVRVLHALASKVTEGTTYASGGPVTGAKRPNSAAAAIFPNLPSAGGT